MKKETYVISLEEARREYRENGMFRDMLDSDCFVYAENSYVINVAEYIVSGEDGTYTLTDYARSHLDECALVFEETEIIKYIGDKKRGGQPRMGITTIEKKCATKYVSYSQGKGLDKKILEMRRGTKLIFEENVSGRMTCWERICGILTDLGIDKKAFCRRTSLIEKVYDRVQKNDASMPEIKTIVTIAAAFDIDYFETKNLLALAGHTLSPVSEEHNCYEFILTAMHGCSMQAKNELLVKEGFEPLGSKSRKSEE